MIDTEMNESLSLMRSYSGQPRAGAALCGTRERTMAMKNRKANDQAEIRRLVEQWAEALRAKDVDGIMSHYASDLVVFDLAPPLQYKGANAYRENWQAWFPTFQGSIGYE